MDIRRCFTLVIWICIPVCFCFGQKNVDWQKKYEDAQRRYNETVPFVEKSNKQDSTISDILSRLQKISQKPLPIRINPEGINSPMYKEEQIDFYLSDLSTVNNDLQKAKNDLQKAKSEMQKARSANKEQLATIEKQLEIIEEFQSIVKLQQEEITVLRTVNSAWVAFNKNEYDNAYSLFLSSNESGKKAGSQLFLNKAKQLMNDLNGKFDSRVKKLLIYAQNLDNTQEIRDLINKYR